MLSAGLKEKKTYMVKQVHGKKCKVKYKRDKKNNLFGQERLLPSCLHHDHPGATALKTATVFLALIRGEMPPQRSVKSRVSGPIWSHTNRDIHGWPSALRDATAGVKQCAVYRCRRFSGDTAGQSLLNHPDIYHSQGHRESCYWDQQHFAVPLFIWQEQRRTPSAVQQQQD